MTEKVILYIPVPPAEQNMSNNYGGYVQVQQIPTELSREDCPPLHIQRLEFKIWPDSPLNISAGGGNLPTVEGTIRAQMVHRLTITEKSLHEPNPPLNGPRIVKTLSYYFHKK